MDKPVRFVFHFRPFQAESLKYVDSDFIIFSSSHFSNILEIFIIELQELPEKRLWKISKLNQIHWLVSLALKVSNLIAEFVVQSYI